MRTHKQIIRDAGGPLYVATILGMTDTPWTVRSWSARSSIPAPYWLELAVLGLASLEELAEAAARPPPPRRFAFQYVIDGCHRMLAMGGDVALSGVRPKP